MSNFYTLLTRVGAALHANAQVNQTTVPWTHMRLGDGNGAAVTPNENQTGLVRQVHTLQITDISVHADNPNWVIAEAVVPSDVGGWTVREAAIYGGADGNTCIAVGNYPETYKPVLAEGAGREMVMRMVVEISSVATVKLQIDPAVAIASRAWVESLVATPAKAGLVKLASLQEHLDGESSSKAATPAGVHAVVGIAADQVMGEVLLNRGRIDVLESNLPTKGSTGDGTAHWQIVDGVITQWGYTDAGVGGDGVRTITFPIPFPTKVTGVFVTRQLNSVGNDSWGVVIGMPTTTSMVIGASYSSGVPDTARLFWEAKGQ